MVPWPWYRHVPALPLWGLILGALVLVKSNRTRWQAWLIWLPFVALSLVAPMLTRLLSMPGSASDVFGSFVVGLAAAWCIVWLLADPLARVRGRAAFLLAFAAMIAVGAVACASFFGREFGRSTLPWPAMFVCCSAALLLASVVSGWCCRKRFRPKTFLAWFLLWLPMATALTMPLLAAVIAFLESPNENRWGVFLTASLALVMVGPIAGFLLYVLHLPFAILALRCSLYGERLARLLRLQVIRSGSPFGVFLPASAAADTMAAAVEHAATTG